MCVLKAKFYKMGQGNKDKNASVRFLKLIGNGKRTVFLVWKKARSKGLNDRENDLGIFIPHLLVMG